MPGSNSFTWEEVFIKYPRREGVYPGAAPVSAFQYQKAPLSPYWDRLAFVGTVGEVELKANLSNYVSPKKRKLLREQGGSIKERLKDPPQYWFVEVIQFEGYLLKVRFLGFPEEMLNQLKEREMWIHYNQLQEIGNYKQEGSDAAMPPIPGYDPEDGEILKRLYDQIVGKFTINPLRSGWLKHAEECIRWKTGVKVEARNTECCTEMLRGFVGNTVGRRVKVLNWGASVRKGSGTWVHEDSDLIKPEGWSKTVGAKMDQTVKTYDPAELPPSSLGVDLSLENTFSNIKVGQLFEFINPIKLDEIAVGKVTEVLKYGYFRCRIESFVLPADLDTHTKGVNEFHYHITSGQLFPLGTFSKEVPSPRPLDVIEEESFEWSSYLEKTGSEALVLPPKNEDDEVHNFKENMWIEAVDSHKPELVCPAVILKIVHPYAIRVGFLGWPKEFDQWKPIKSFEIFPVGWCQFSDYPLTPPQNGNIDLPIREQVSSLVLPDNSVPTQVDSPEESDQGRVKRVRGRSMSSVKSTEETGSPREQSPKSSSRKSDKTPVKLTARQRILLQWEMHQSSTETNKGDVDLVDEEPLPVLKKQKMTTTRAKKGTGTTTSRGIKNKPSTKKRRVIRSSSSGSGSDIECMEIVEGKPATSPMTNREDSFETDGSRRRSSRARSSTQFFGDNVDTRLMN